MDFFARSPMRNHPTFAMVHTMLLLAALSFYASSDKPLESLFEYLKVFAYFVLFLALVNTPARLRALTAVITLCVMVTATIGILHFTQIISIPKLEVLGENIERENGEVDQERRLRFTGMLQDPNEVAVVLAMLVFLCAHQWQNRAFGLFRHLWLVPLTLFLGAIAFTSSRGGFLALMSGTVAFAIYRFQNVRIVQIAPGVHTEVYKPGGNKAIGFLILMLPIAVIGFGGRQTNISPNEGTANGRIGLWSDWLGHFRDNPLLGVSPVAAATAEGEEKPLAHLNVSHLAHNSYLQAFADLGFVGGMCYLGAFLLGLQTLNRYAFGHSRILDLEQKRLHPYLVGSVVAYMAGMISLSINYLITTAFVLALPLAFYGMTPCYPPVRPPAMGQAGLFRLALIAVGVLGTIYMMARLFRNY